MSQAVVDFCNGLETTLLAVEAKIGEAQRGLASGVAGLHQDAATHLAEATQQLSAFRGQASEIAQSLRASAPAEAVTAVEKLKEFGAEAQVALRHAMIFVAEAASKGAAGAADALQAGSERALSVAEALKRETAVAALSEAPAPTSTPA